MKIIITTILTIVCSMSVTAQKNDDFSKLQELTFEHLEDALKGLYSEDRVYLKVKIEQKKDNNSKRNYRYIIQVKIDGTWSKVVDEKNTIKRDFSYESEENIERIETFIKEAIEFEEGDMISVVAAKFDRSKEFELEDKSYLNSKSK